MSSYSKIEWTEKTWNPTSGCTKISPGCKHCYAETMAKRLKAMGAVGYENGFELSLQPHRLNQPAGRKKSTIYFVNSMSDLFHEDVPDTYITQVIDTINKTPHHTYQILTKRAKRMRQFFASRATPRNLWLGVSVEDVEYGIPRINELREISSAVRFLSIEPLLEDLGCVNLSDIDWVIVGGESGPKARPVKAEWIEGIQRQCQAQSVAFFFKQWGSWGADGKKRSKRENGHLLNGQVWRSYPNAAGLGPAAW